ncbi:MAG: hypothetical protein ACTSVY_00880 [Candidatus Helarchaeota archaeon]
MSLKEEDFLKELESELRKLEINPEKLKTLDKKYKLIKGREHLLLILLQKFMTSYMAKVMDIIHSDVQMVIQENLKIFKKISDENIQQVKKLTGDTRKEVLQITRGIQNKLDKVENSWIQIAESLGKLSEYGFILGDFQAKSNVMLEKLESLINAKK